METSIDEERLKLKDTASKVKKASDSEGGKKKQGLRLSKSDELEAALGSTGGSAGGQQLVGFDLSEISDLFEVDEKGVTEPAAAGVAEPRAAAEAGIGEKPVKTAPREPSVVQLEDEDFDDAPPVLSQHDEEGREPSVVNLDDSFDEELDGLSLELDFEPEGSLKEDTEIDYEEAGDLDLSGLDEMLDEEETQSEALDLDEDEEDLDPEEFVTVEFNAPNMYKALADDKYYDEEGETKSGEDFDFSDMGDLAGRSEDDSSELEEESEEEVQLSDSLESNLEDLGLVLDDEEKEAESSSSDELAFDIDMDEEGPVSEEREPEELDLDLELEEEEGAEVSAEESDELDLDLDLDEEPSEEEASDELEFELDLEEEEAEAPAEESDELDLDFELDEESESSEAPVEASEELEFELDLEEEVAEAPAEESEDLDFELDIDDEELSEALPEESEELQFDLDFEAEPSEELDLELDEEKEISEEAVEESEELVFDLDIDEGAPEGAASEEPELELDLEEEEVAESSLEESEELELEIDLEEEVVAEAPAEEAEDLALDFDLGEDEAELPEEESEDFELDIQLDEAPEEASDDFDLDMEAEELPEEEESDDFAFDVDFESEPAEEEEDDFEFKLDLEPEAEEADGNLAMSSEEFDIDLDLEDDSPELAGGDETTIFTMDLEGEQEAGAEEDFEFEFEMDEGDEEDEAGLTQVYDMGIPAEADDEDFMSDDETMIAGMDEDMDVSDAELETVVGDYGEAEDEDKAPVKAVKRPRAEKPKRKSRRKFLLALLLLGGGGYGLYAMRDSDAVQGLMGMASNIPVVGDYIPVDDGAILPLNTTISGRFVKNADAGLLFVITGNARNDYRNPRDFIKVTGKLFTKGKTLAKEKTVYAGNTLTDMELSDLSMDMINERLSRRSGDKGINTGVGSGQTIPFMVVFSELPQDLDQLEEYSVAAAGSQPAG